MLSSAEFTPEQQERPEEWVELWSQRMGITDLSDKTLQGLSAYADDTIIHTKQKNAGLRGLLQLVLISPEAQMK